MVERIKQGLVCACLVAALFLLVSLGALSWKVYDSVGRVTPKVEAVLDQSSLVEQTANQTLAEQKKNITKLEVMNAKVQKRTMDILTNVNNTVKDFHEALPGLIQAYQSAPTSLTQTMSRVNPILDNLSEASEAMATSIPISLKNTQDASQNVRDITYDGKLMADKGVVVMNDTSKAIHNYFNPTKPGWLHQILLMILGNAVQGGVRR